MTMARVRVKLRMRASAGWVSVPGCRPTELPVWRHSTRSWLGVGVRVG